MSAAPPASGKAKGKNPWWLRGVAVTAAVVVVLAALVFLPFHSSSREVQFLPGSWGSTELALPQPGWVTVHFDRVGGYGGMMGNTGMTYWMEGPGGAMFNHSMMHRGDVYSFWTWGGTYRCGAGYAAAGEGPVSVWVNATWGLL